MAEYTPSGREMMLLVHIGDKTPFRSEYTGIYAFIFSYLISYFVNRLLNSSTWFTCIRN